MLTSPQIFMKELSHVKDFNEFCKTLSDEMVYSYRNHPSYYFHLYNFFVDESKIYPFTNANVLELKRRHNEFKKNRR